MFLNEIFSGYLQDQGRLLTNFGSWLRNRSGDDRDFIPLGPDNLFPNTGNLSESGFLANGTVFTMQNTKISSYYICEYIGMYSRFSGSFTARGVSSRDPTRV